MLRLNKPYQRKSQHVRDCYLLHIVDKDGNDAKLCHTRHYIGIAKDVNARVQQHHNGDGSRFCAAVKRAGLTFVLARVWHNVDGYFERALKNRHGASQFCPMCNKNVKVFETWNE